MLTCRTSGVLSGIPGLEALRGCACGGPGACGVSALPHAGAFVVPRKRRGGRGRGPGVLCRAVAMLGMWLLLWNIAPGQLDRAEAGGPVVRMATLTDFPPHCFDREKAETLIEETIPPGKDSQRIRGYAWDVVRESYHARGHTIRLHVVPWSRGMHYVETGKVDAIFPAMRTAKREKRFLFSQEPVIRLAFIVYVPSSSSFGWKGLSSLNGKRIVGVRGWAFGRDWEANEKIVKLEAYSIPQGFEMVRKGWVFGIAGYDVPFDYVLNQNGLTHEFRKLPSWGATEEYVLGSKQGDRTQELLEAFDAGKRIIEENGILRSIKEKWR